MADPIRTAERTRRRFARRQWRRRLHLWRTGLVAVLAVASVAATAGVVFFSSWLSVETVRVRGLELVTEASVVALADVPMGEPLVRVDTDAVGRRVAALSPVLRVEVTKAWPDEVLIEVTERQVVATVEIGETVRGMDSEGVLFRDYSRAPRGLPRIRSRAAVDSETLEESGRVLASLPAELAGKVDYVSVESIDRVTLVLRDGRTVLWGSAEESADKARVLATLLGATKARYLDVSVPGLPTFR
ncbi:MAG: cell division protein FtsQ/DivIB [Nocardioides sp.]